MKNNKISTDSYKKDRVTKGIWYRIISVLSAITVFCTTYALILPAITMEDPTLGVKLNNKFEFESELLNIDFYVSGRAIFKDKDVESQNDFADFDDVSDYAKEHLLKISALKIINGYEDKTFKPKALCTRAEAAVVIYKTAMLLKEYN